MNIYSGTVFRGLFIAVCSLFSLYLYAENTVYEFGPKTDNVIVFTASASADNESTTATVQLQEFARKLSHQPPDFHIIIAITKNDISELPADVPVKRYGGIKQLIQTLNSYTNAAVCVIGQGSKDRVRLTAGTSAGTAPAWFLQTAYHTMMQEALPVDFYSNALIFHRLGMLPDDPVLRLFNEAALPALKIETNTDLAGFFTAFPADIHHSMTNEWDTHYFTHKINKKLVIITERHIVRILIFSSMLILLWLVVFSFLFGKKREQHLKDLLLLWWMPLYFFLVNCAGFFLGTKLAELLFYLRFSSGSDMSLFPLTVLAFKYCFALFFMLVFTAFNRVIPLPANRFIYGFMAHTVCLLNIFIFSFINLSFSIIFLLVFFISFAAYQVKNTVLQGILLVCLFFPVIPFAYHIFIYRDYVFDIILHANIEPALIFIPFDLFLLRLVLSIDKKRKEKKSRRRASIPMYCKLAGVLLAALILRICVMPAAQQQSRQDFILTQRITEEGSTVVKKYTGFSQKEAAAMEYVRSAAVETPEHPDSFLTVKASLTHYFERSIGSITLDSSIRAEAVSITVRAQNGVAVFEADAPFEQNASGDTAVFISTPRPALPRVIHFSGKKNADLTVTVTVWSKENYFNLVLPGQEDGMRHGNFLLEITKTLALTPEDDEAV
ncbi:MAG: hypothetical protein P1P65_05510 [Treponema sp.]